MFSAVAVLLFAFSVVCDLCWFGGRRRKSASASSERIPIQNKHGSCINTEANSAAVAKTAAQQPQQRSLVAM